MKINVKKLHQDAVIPKYHTNGSSGFDLHALEDVTIEPGQTVLVRTGLAFDVGYGYEMQIRPRSGFSLNSPLRVSNSPGTIDSDFRGEVCVIFTHIGTEKSWEQFHVKKGERIAQGVICPVIQADIEEVDYLNETIRGENGFGSTGN